VTQPIRVGHLTTVDSSLRYLLEAQLVGAMEAGYDVIGISAPGHDVEYLKRLGIEHVALQTSTRSFSLRSDMRAVVDLFKELRQLDLDILHTHNPKPGLYGRVAGRLAGVRYIVNTVHGLYAMPEDSIAKRGIVYSAEAIASRFSNRELIQNEEDLELLGAKRITARRKLVHLGNGVDLERFKPDRDARRRSEILAGHDIDPDRVVIGMVARLVEEKGLRELFEAAKTLPSNAVVVVVGPHDAERHDALSKESVAEATSQGVRLVGHQPDTALWYNAMDIFVLPSYREGVPRGAMEAAASGLPIVTTNVRGCRQVVVDRSNGYLVPARDAGSLERALTELVLDAELRRSMGDAGRRRAEEFFDERDVVERVLSCYRELLA